MDLNFYLQKANGGFASANNNKFVNYTGNVAYFVSKEISKYQEDKVLYFTCKDANFQVNGVGYIIWESGQWLDGIFFGDFQDGIFWNGQLHAKKQIVNIINGRFFEL